MALLQLNRWHLLRPLRPVGPMRSGAQRSHRDHIYICGEEQRWLSCLRYLPDREPILVTDDLHACLGTRKVAGGFAESRARRVCVGGSRWVVHPGVQYMHQLVLDRVSDALKDSAQFLSHRPTRHSTQMPTTRSVTQMPIMHKRREEAAPLLTSSDKSHDAGSRLEAGNKRQARERQTVSPLDNVCATLSPIQGQGSILLRVGRSEAGGYGADRMLQTFGALGPTHEHALINLCDDYARHRRVVLLDDAACIATAVVKVTSLLQGRQRVLEIPFFVIDKPARGKGIGLVLVEALVRLGQELGCTLMVVFAIKASLGFWTKAQMQDKPEPGVLKRNLAEFRACSADPGFRNTILMARAL